MQPRTFLVTLSGCRTLLGAIEVSQNLTCMGCALASCGKFCSCCSACRSRVQQAVRCEAAGSDAVLPHTARSAATLRIVLHHDRHTLRFAPATLKPVVASARFLARQAAQLLQQRGCVEAVRSPARQFRTPTSWATRRVPAPAAPLWRCLAPSHRSRSSG